MGYYLMFNIPIVIYFLIFVYVFFKYEKGYLADYQPTSEILSSDAEAPLAPTPNQNKNKLSHGLYNKLH